jgi:ADP-heptose:LPS heptosyltransferase
LIAKALPDVRLVSVQQQGRIEAGLSGVEHHSFEDFADCAALMMCCDEIVTIDTAAVHLAGAIGHPCVKLLLSHWASWRWLAPLYSNIKICRQESAGDWASALGKL